MADLEDDRLVDDAAEEPDEEEDEEEEEGEGAPVDSSEEEEDDEQNEYDMTDKFLVQDDEEEEGGGGGGDDDSERSGSEAGGDASARKRRRKRARDEEEELDEEDYQLLEENQVTGFRRKRPDERRRIRKRTEEAGAAAGDKTASERLQETLFGRGGEEDGLEDLVEDGAAERQADVEEDFGDGDDDDGFIVDDVAGGGQRRRRRQSEGFAGMDAEGLREAQEIFGDVNEFLEIYRSRKQQQPGAEDEEEEDDVASEDLEDPDAADNLRAEREARRKARQQQRIAQQIEPAQLDKFYMRPEDDAIRAADLPEREQLLRGSSPEPLDLDAATEWIYNNLFGRESKARLERILVEEGRMEVDGAPPDGRQRWGRHELAGDIEVLAGRRGVRNKRDADARKDWRNDEAAQERLRASLREVLRHLFDRHEEVPVIGSYRKEAAGELLALRSNEVPRVTTYSSRDAAKNDPRNPHFPEGTMQAHHRQLKRWDVLWGVHAFAHKFLLLQRAKSLRASSYAAAAERAASDQEKEAIESCIEAMKEAKNMEAVEDVDSKFRLVRATAGAEALAGMRLTDGGTPAGPSARPRASSSYTLCQRAGLEATLAGLGLSAGQYAENLEMSYKKHEPEDLRLEPEEFASQHTTTVGGFSSPAAVLRGMVHMAAQQVAAEPNVREFVRTLFLDNAVVHTEPTASGEEALDPFHALGVVKRLRDKRLRTFEDSDLWLRIDAAVRASFVTARLELAPEGYDKVLRELRDLYTSDGVSPISQAWNKLREDVLREALKDTLIPACQRDARAALYADAREFALERVGDELWAYASQAPLQIKMPDDDDNVERRRIMAACWGPGGAAGPATVLVQLDENGALVDSLACTQFSGALRRPGRGDADVMRDPRTAKDADRIRKFIMEHQPHALVVGAASLEARSLLVALTSIRDSILYDHPQFFTRHETGHVDIRFADERLAQLWESCEAAMEEMAEQQAQVRRAVALARTQLDPLAVLAALAGRGREVLSLPLHALAAQLGPDALMATVQRVLVTVTAQVGADINAMAAHAWRSAPLQFVPGLGPRKAAALLRAVGAADAGHVTSRHQLWKELLDQGAPVLGNKVFRNCGGFVRVLATGAGMANVQVDALDGSRIHPESYALAIKMAQDALGGAGAGGRGAGDQLVVDRAMERRADVEALDLGSYAAHLAGQRTGDNRLSTLIDIQFELLAPGGELRPELRPLKEDELFWLLTGYTRDTLKPGKKVEARVRWVGIAEARLTLNDTAQVDAYLGQTDLSSSDPGARMEDRLRKDMTVLARIKEVQADQFRVVLTTASADLEDEARWEKEYCKVEERAYVVLTNQERKEAASQKSAARPKAFTSRPIQHPLFANVSKEEALARLAERAPGAALVYPSLRGPHELRLAVKLHQTEVALQQLVVEYAICEAPKAGGSQLQLSTPLTVTLPEPIGAQQYEDLDELSARFVDPLVDAVRQVLRHRKFKDGLWTSVSDELAAERDRLGPGAAAYCMAAIWENPGAFLIAHCGVSRSNPAPTRGDYFVVTPEGYLFRKRPYKSVEHVLAAWKKAPTGDRSRESRPRADTLGYNGPPPPPHAAPPPRAQPSATPLHAAAPPMHGLPPAQAAGHGPPYVAAGSHAPYGAAAGQPPAPPAAPPAYGSAYGYQAASAGYQGYAATQPAAPQWEAAARGSAAAPNAPPPWASAAGGYANGAGQSQAGGAGYQQPAGLGQNGGYPQHAGGAAAYPAPGGPAGALSDQALQAQRQAAALAAQFARQHAGQQAQQQYAGYASQQAGLAPYGGTYAQRRPDSPPPPPPPPPAVR